MFNKIKKGESVNVGGDKADATQIRQIIRLTQQATQSIEAHAIKTMNQQIAVQENIAKRAEMREKKGQYGVPNIAKLLTGGAGGTMGHIGRMQKMAEKPFKQQSEYYQYQQGHKAKMQPGQGGFADTGYRTEKEYETAVTEGADKKKKAGGTAFLGKKMNSMIGKVGKFMDSGKGQGLMAGGMAGAGIITMIIKKAMEASPMLQQMLKIMNVAMTLFLRPIGDFIGGMLKPIMLFFLKEVAIPMLKSGKDMIKYGEAFGKGALGFLLKPVETIREAVGVFFGQGSGYDGLKAWMSENKLTAIAAQLEKANPGLAGYDLSKEGIASAIRDENALATILYANNKDLMTDFITISNEMYDKSYTKINELYKGAQGGAGGGVGAGMGLSAALFDKMEIAGNGLTVSFNSLQEAVDFQRNMSKATGMTEGLGAWTDELVNWLRSGQISMEEFENAINYLLTGQIANPLDEVGEQLEETVTEVEHQSGQIEGILGEINVIWKDAKVKAEETGEVFAGMASLSLEAYNKVKALLASIRGAQGGYQLQGQRLYSVHGQILPLKFTSCCSLCQSWC